MNLPFSLPSLAAGPALPAVSLEPVADGGRFKAGVCQYPTHPNPTPYPASLAAVGIPFADRRQHPAGRMLSGTTEHTRTDPRVSGRLGADACGVSDSTGCRCDNGKDLIEPPIRLLELDLQNRPRGADGRSRLLPSAIRAAGQLIVAPASLL